MLATESFGSNSGRITSIDIKEASLVDQPVMAVNVAPHQVKKVYHENVLIGVLSSPEDLDAFLQQVYIESYQADFPNTEIGLGKDIFITTETSYMTYDNVDTEIFEYLKQNDLFSVSVFKIKFSNGALIYVKDTKMFEEAKEQYLLNFVSRSAYELLKKKLLPPDLTTYEPGFSRVLMTDNPSRMESSLTYCVTSGYTISCAKRSLVTTTLKGESK